LIIFSLILLWLVWGTNAGATKVAIATIPPLLMSGICFIIAGSIFLSYSVVRGGDRNHVTDLAEWKRSIIIGAIMLLGGQGLRTVGEVQLSSGMTSLIFAIVPLWIIIIGSLFFNKKISKLAASMIIIGFLGVVIITVFFSFEDSDSSSSSININIKNLEVLGILFLVGASFLWAAGSSYMNKSTSSILKSGFTSQIGKQMLVGGILLSLSGIFFGELNSFDLVSVSFESFLGMFYMILVGSLIGYPVFVWLLKSTSQVLANSFTFISPFISLVIGVTILDESISSFVIVAAAIMILGSVATIMVMNIQREDR
jgi:drug/metabolite transporter (DMT)-like permease